MEAGAPRTWETYEDVARHLLETMSELLGLDLVRVEGKQRLSGKSGTTWTVDAKGVKSGDEAIVVVECRRKTTSRLNQEAMAAVAYRISDVGAVGGIVVTPIGVQKGAQIVANSASITVIHLDEDSTTTDYILRFLGDVFIGASSSPTAITATITAAAEVNKARNTGTTSDLL